MYSYVHLCNTQVDAFGNSLLVKQRFEVQIQDIRATENNQMAMAFQWS